MCYCINHCDIFRYPGAWIRLSIIQRTQHHKTTHTHAHQQVTSIHTFHNRTRTQPIAPAHSTSHKQEWSFHNPRPSKCTIRPVRHRRYPPRHRPVMISVCRRRLLAAIWTHLEVPTPAPEVKEWATNRAAAVAAIISTAADFITTITTAAAAGFMAAAIGITAAAPERPDSRSFVRSGILAAARAACQWRRTTSMASVCVRAWCAKRSTIMRPLLGR